jgi:hypothetical protein
MKAMRLSGRYRSDGYNCSAGTDVEGTTDIKDYVEGLLGPSPALWALRILLRFRSDGFS